MHGTLADFGYNRASQPHGEEPLSEARLDALLARIREHMQLDSETEHEVVAEVHAHLREALDEALAQGLGEEAAIQAVAARFGLEETGQELQAAHAGWGTADAVIAAGLPAVCALILRWLVFAPDGTALGWPQLLNRPVFWIVALVMLLVPLLRFGRWRYAAAGWVVFWTLTVVYVTWPALRW
jgi:hypothetical protein